MNTIDMTTEETNSVQIRIDDVSLEGILEIPDGARGLVIFSHGSGSSRLSTRNNYVAGVIREQGYGTLLFDLLTEEEDRLRENRFDIPLLTERLVDVTRWLGTKNSTAGLNLGYFGSSTGAASALHAAAQLPGEIGAIVSRGGRVDLASNVIDSITMPTLFIVGGADTQVLELNREVFELLPCEKSFHVIEGAGHLFERDEELEEVANVAANWFANQLQ